MWHVVICRGKKINWQLNDTPCEDDKRHLVAQEEVGSEGFCNDGLMTIHKRFSVRWSTRLGSCALESWACQFPSPQKGAAIDGGGCEREITQNSALGPSQVTSRRGELGGAHIWHTIGATRGQLSQWGGSAVGLTAADTFHTTALCGALFSSSARILFILSNWHGFDVASCRLCCSDLWPCPELWSIGDKFERPCCNKAQFKCALSEEGCRRQAKGLIDDLLTPFRWSGHFLPMSLMVTAPPPPQAKLVISLERCPWCFLNR